MSHLTCSLYYACRHPSGNPELWCDRFLHIALPSLSPEKFFSHLAGKGWIKIADGEYGETMKLDEWLELNILQWYLRYGNTDDQIELMGYLDCPKRDNDASSESSDSDVEPMAENDSENHIESAVMIHPASGAIPGTPCTTITTCSPSSHGTTADKPDCEVSNKSVSDIPDLHAFSVVTNEETEERTASEQTTTDGTRVPPLPPSAADDVTNNATVPPFVTNTAHSAPEIPAPEPTKSTITSETSPPGRSAIEVPTTKPTAPQFLVIKPKRKCPHYGRKLKTMAKKLFRRG